MDESETKRVACVYPDKPAVHAIVVIRYCSGATLTRVYRKLPKGSILSSPVTTRLCPTVRRHLAPSLSPPVDCTFMAPSTPKT
jgi:hypothetical protein